MIEKEHDINSENFATLKTNTPNDEIVKTFNQHDFTGYSNETLKRSIDILSEYQPLPGPLNIVYRSLLSAWKKKNNGSTYSNAS
jgi:hypothetical protein